MGIPVDRFGMRCTLCLSSDGTCHGWRTFHGRKYCGRRLTGLPGDMSSRLVPMGDNPTIEGHRVSDIRAMMKYIETANLLLVWKHTESDRLRQIVGQEMLERDQAFVAEYEQFLARLAADG